MNMTDADDHRFSEPQLPPHRQIDQRSLDHPVTRLAAEYGWHLDEEIGGCPGRCLYTGPGGKEVLACLTFDDEASAGESAVYYAFPFPQDPQWITVNHLPLLDQMTHLRRYFSETAPGRR